MRTGERQGPKVVRSSCGKGVMPGNRWSLEHTLGRHRSVRAIPGASARPFAESTAPSSGSPRLCRDHLSLSLRTRETSLRSAFRSRRGDAGATDDAASKRLWTGDRRGRPLRDEGEWATSGVPRSFQSTAVRFAVRFGGRAVGGRYRAVIKAVSLLTSLKSRSVWPELFQHATTRQHLDTVTPKHGNTQTRQALIGAEVNHRDAGQ